MKTHISLLASANGAMANAISKSEELTYNLRIANNITKEKRNRMKPHIRDILADLTKFIHEANAYYNALDTE